MDIRDEIEEIVYELTLLCKVRDKQEVKYMLDEIADRITSLSSKID